MDGMIAVDVKTLIFLAIWTEWNCLDVYRADS